MSEAGKLVASKLLTDAIVDVPPWNIFGWLAIGGLVLATAMQWDEVFTQMIRSLASDTGLLNIDTSGPKGDPNPKLRKST